MPWGYRLGWYAFRAVFAGYFRWRVFHAERVPVDGPVILAPNHQSFLDPPLVGAGLGRPVGFLARRSLFEVPVLGRVLRLWEVIPVDRDGGSGAGLKSVLERLEAGGAVLVFPEGTRSADGRLQPARSGIGLIAIKSGAPVVPVRVFGTFEALGRGARWPKPRSVTVKYGWPLRFPEWQAEAQTCAKPRLKEIYQQVADRIMAAIAAIEPGPDKPELQNSGSGETS